MEYREPVIFLHDSSEPVDLDLAEVDAAIAMVSSGAATRVRLTGLRHPDAVAGAALARAQAAHVGFELDRTELPVLTFGPAD
jgi:hypothetical protein